MSIVENIKWLCKQRDISIPKIEKELGFGNGAIYNWDKNSPTVGKLQPVADYLDVSVDFLISGFDREIINIIKELSTFDLKKGAYFNNKVLNIMNIEMEPLKREYYDVPLDLGPVEMIGLIREFPVTIEFKEDFLKVLKTVQHKINNTQSSLSPKEERDIAVDLEKMMSNLESDQALAFHGEPMDEDDKELLKISLENSMRLAKQIAKKKFTPKKYR